MQVNEIFYSIQGEGRHTGVAAVFVRFSKCNLKCHFCDTDFWPYSELNEDEIVDKVVKLGGNSTHVVITGGEPTLQLTETLCEKLHAAGKFIQIETNGTRVVPKGVDWVTCSPKFEFNINAELRVDRIDELKLVYDCKNNMGLYEGIIENYNPKYCYLQPCDLKDAKKNAEIIKDLVKYIQKHPRWRISLQTHKILSLR